MENTRYIKENEGPKIKHFVLVLFLAAIFWGINAFANMLYLYWSYLWIHIFMHTAGGILVGIFCILLLFYFAKKYPSRAKVFFISFGSALLVGVLWEILEIKTGASRISPNYVASTVLDLRMDMLGGILAYVCWYLWHRKNKK